MLCQLLLVMMLMVRLQRHRAATPSRISCTTRTPNRTMMRMTRIDRKRVDLSNLLRKANKAKLKLKHKPKAKKLAELGKSQQDRAISATRVMSRWISYRGRLPVVSPVSLLLQCSRTVADDKAANPNAKTKSRRPGQDASRFKTDKSGKMIIPDDNDDGEHDDPASRSMEGTAFIAAQSGIDGSNRDAKGNLRFNKNTKRSRMEDDDMDVDFDESIKKAYMPEQKKTKKREVSKKLGEEFKSKVSQIQMDGVGQLADLCRGQVGISRSKVDLIRIRMSRSDRLRKRVKVVEST